MNRQGASAGALLQAWLAFPMLVAATTLPLDAERPESVLLHEGEVGRAVVAVMALAAFAAVRLGRTGITNLFVAVAAHAGAWFEFRLLPDLAGHAGPGFWSLLASSWLLAWCLVSKLAGLRPLARSEGFVLKILVPLLFGAWVLILWQVMVVALKVPFVLLPPPSAIFSKLMDSVPILAVDFRQTFLKAVLAGYVIGCGAGFLVAILVDRVPFLSRGLLPIGSFVSALPIVGVAPIMVMWFGFDWQSKAAVVVIMTFFPMLVNTVAGLAAAPPMSRDLMRTYAASYWQSLFKLRLPEALPFVFNALKINSTLALIGAIVAEFFGTPIVGMGFRISTEVGRMNIDMVWAEIAVAAVAGSAFYGVMALIERACTFWHPSFHS